MEIPVSAWDQIGIVIIFTLLMGVMVRVFQQSVEKITNYYTEMIKGVTSEFSKALGESNIQWQLYFDAKSKATELIEQEIIAELKSLSEHHEAHDIMVRNALDQMAQRRRKLAKAKAA